MRRRPDDGQPWRRSPLLESVVAMQDYTVTTDLRRQGHHLWRGLKSDSSPGPWTMQNEQVDRRVRCVVRLVQLHVRATDRSCRRATSTLRAEFRFLCSTGGVGSAAEHTLVPVHVERQWLLLSAARFLLMRPGVLCTDGWENIDRIEYNLCLLKLERHHNCHKRSCDLLVNVS